VSPTELATTLAGLARAGLVEQDPTGAITGAHGLTLAPTRHHLVLAGVDLHTWCALDAIGIPAAVDTDAEIATRCGWCDGQPADLLPPR
jgi:alkylmercury lyase